MYDFIINIYNSIHEFWKILKSPEKSKIIQKSQNKKQKMQINPQKSQKLSKKRGGGKLTNRQTHRDYQVYMRKILFRLPFDQHNLSLCGGLRPQFGGLRPLKRGGGQTDTQIEIT